MKNITKLILCIFLWNGFSQTLAASQAVASSYRPNRFIAAINKSALVSRIDSWQHNIFQLAFKSAKNADALYVQFGSDAQKAYGCDQEITIKVMPDEMLKSAKDTVGFAPSACTFPTIILINVEKLNTHPYGLKRFTIYHEMAHAYYHDFTCAALASVLMLPPLATLCHYLGSKTTYGINHNKLLWAASICAGNFLCTLLTAPYDRYYEHRADLCAAHACNCAQCMHEVAQYRAQQTALEQAIIKKNGYLTAAEAEKIAQEFKEKNCLCTYHREHASA